VEAIGANGLERLLRVYDALADPERLKEASLHVNGNFGVQRLLEAAAKLRAALHGHAAQVGAARVGGGPRLRLRSVAPCIQPQHGAP
jgi:hypothetical protein